MTPSVIAATVALVGALTARSLIRGSARMRGGLVVPLLVALIATAAAIRPDHVWGWVLGFVVGASVGLEFARPGRMAHGASAEVVRPDRG